ncbi:MAG: nuclear transport factor 2 family protein [Pseudonocardiales bacterium]|nr:nuclear transport factor 2 family protein [Pseudonocardiales bacterium]
MTTQPTIVQTGLDPDTRWQISEVLSLYGHIVDNQEWTYLPQVFTADAALDAQYTSAKGIAEIQKHLESFGPWRSHHTLNTITKRSGAEVSAWSRFLVVEASGITISGDYVDTLTNTEDGWRIRSRRISLRNRPDQTPDGQAWRTESFSTWNAE